MADDLVLYNLNAGIAFLTLNHSQKRNALSSHLLATLGKHLQTIAGDSAARVVVLRSAGAVFSSGHDLRELYGRSESEYARLFALCSQVMEQIRKLPQPVIAQVQGLATAAGCQLVASCDLVVASENAAFATPGVKIGLFCTTPGVALSRAIGSKKSLEMLLTGDPISAGEAERIGLVNRVVPADQLEAETLNLARKIAAASSQTIRLGKQAFYEQLGRDRPAAYQFAEQIMVQNAQMADAKEGIGAFLEKREPHWSS